MAQNEPEEDNKASSLTCTAARHVQTLQINTIQHFFSVPVWTETKVASRWCLLRSPRRLFPPPPLLEVSSSWHHPVYPGSGALLSCFSTIIVSIAVPCCDRISVRVTNIYKINDNCSAPAFKSHPSYGINANHKLPCQGLQVVPATGVSWARRHRSIGHSAGLFSGDSNVSSLCQGQAP